MKSIIKIIICIFTFIDLFSQPCGKLKVTYEGKTYNTVQIGNQCWLKENLNVGTRINGNKDASDNNKIEKYCYADRESNCDIYGGLYQWNEAMGYSTAEGAQGICPKGWHIPTLAEFELLISEVNEDGNSLKARGQGEGFGAGTNRSGFSALLAGTRYYNGSFCILGNGAIFWSSTERYNIDTYYLNLGSDDSSLGLYAFPRGNGFSVRCIKD